MVPKIPDMVTTGLNSQQLQAVLSHDGPLICVAGAGSGKTTALTRRVAHMIKSGIDPQSILLLAFTRASAKEMVRRAQSLCSDASKVTGGTFHSIGSIVLREFGQNLGLAENFTILDPDDVVDALRLIISDLPRDLSAYPHPATIRNCISFAYNTNSKVSDVIRTKYPKWAARDQWFIDCARAYLSYKKQRSLVDYDDILIYWATLLSNPTIANIMQSRWQYVMVDEYQDSNELQIRIVYRLAGSRANLMVVGDPAQAIYGFRGAAPETMFKFREHFPQSKLILLEDNYRSTPEIIAIANAIDGAMLPRFERNLLPMRSLSNSRPILLRVLDSRQESDAISNRILEDFPVSGTYSDHAVLARSMSILRHVETTFIERKIPYKVRGGIKITEAAHIKDVLCALRVFENVQHEPAWMRLLLKVPKIGEQTALRILNKIRQTSNLAEAISNLKAEGASRNFAVEPILAALGAVSAGSDVVHKLQGTITELGPLLERAYDDWSERKMDFDAFLGLAAQFETVRQFLEAVTLDVSVDKAQRFKAGDVHAEGMVTLSTIHSAKGLEWQTVHIPSFVDGCYPGPMAKSVFERQEEIRCFYVAVTRAMTTLIFYRPLIGANGIALRDSEYFQWFSDKVDIIDSEQVSQNLSVRRNFMIDPDDDLLSIF